MEEMIEKSVILMLDTYEGLPRLELNTFAHPSLGCTPNAKNTDTNEHARHVKKRKIFSNGRSELYYNESKQQHEGRKQQHDAADIIDMKKSVQEKYFSKFDVNFKNEEGKYVKSMIAVRMGTSSKNPDQQLANFNEASVSLYVEEVLQDVLHCLHLTSSTRVGQEISIFSMRPDIVVVRWFTKIILVVEVKNPGENGGDVVSNKYAAGQAYDYAMGLYQMGIDHPFVCLSTYDHMRIGTLNSSSELIFEKASEILKKGPINDMDVDQSNKKPTVSPDKTGNLIEIPEDSKKCEDIKHSNKKKRGNKNNHGETTCNRQIYFSEIFDHKNIFKALYFVIVCGIVAVQDSTNDRHQKLVPKEDEEIEQCVAVLTKTAFKWATLKCKATYRLNYKWSPTMKVNLHCVLGQGNSGKVYLGSSWNGLMFAVKLYLFDSKTMESFSGEDNEIEKKSQKERAKEIRDDEAKKWKSLYPDNKRAIYPSELNGVPSLAMPYIASIPTDRRVSLLNDVQLQLKMFAQKGFIYPTNEVRWRHIGLRKGEDGKEKIILVDLESLKNKEKETGEDDLINKQIEMLKERAMNEPVHDGQGFFHN